MKQLITFQYTKQSTVWALILVFLLQTAFVTALLKPQTAEAIFSIGGGVGRATESTQRQNRRRLDRILSENQDIQRQTEQTMQDVTRQLEITQVDNPAQWAANQQMASDVANDMIEFVTAGFGGDPAFVQNIGNFQRSISDLVGSQFIRNLDDTVNTPFSRDLQRSLIGLHQRTMRNESVGFTAGNIPGDHQAFLDGDFSQGGWARFMATTQNPQNTPQGAFFESARQYQNRVTSAVDAEMTKLDWGQGFRSMQECQNVGGQRTCNITTPGTTIAGQLDRALGLGLDSAIGAGELGQEFDNGLEDSFVRLGEQSLTGAGGLLGINNIAAFNFDALLDRFALDPIQFGLDLLRLLFGDDDDITDDEGRIDPEVIQEVVNIVDGIIDVQEEYIDLAIEILDELEQLSDAEVEEWQQEIFGMDAEAMIDEIVNNLQSLEALESRIANITQEAAERQGVTEADILREILQDMSALQSELPGQTDVELLEEDLDRLRQELSE